MEHTLEFKVVRRARETVYWPNMTAEIKDYIAKCEVCMCNLSERAT